MMTAGVGCRTASISDVYQLKAGSLPRDYLARMANTTEALMRSPAASKVVKDLADCIRTFILVEYPERVPTSAITLTHVCGDTFRVDNAGDVWADVTYRVEKTTERGDLVVGPQSNTEFVTETSGRVVLSYMGKDLRRATNRGLRCTPLPGGLDD